MGSSHKKLRRQTAAVDTFLFWSSIHSGTYNADRTVTKLLRTTAAGTAKWPRHANCSKGGLIIKRHIK